MNSSRIMSSAKSVGSNRSDGEHEFEYSSRAACNASTAAISRYVASTGTIAHGHKISLGSLFASSDCLKLSICALTHNVGPR